METLYAYLAGAIDIDGRIFIARAKGYRRRMDGRQIPYYMATEANGVAHVGGCES
jgi:hypothetical protein